MIAPSDSLDMRELTKLPSHGYHHPRCPLKNSQLIFELHDLQLLSQHDLQVDPVAQQFGL